MPAEAIEVIPGQACDAWRKARLMDDWLRTHPGVRVQLMCNRFDSASLRHILSRVLGPERRGQVAVLGLKDRLFDETSWWKSRTGIKAVMFGALCWLYVELRGEAPAPPQRWDPDEYERGLAGLHAEAAP